jgi:hypothetical protein
MVARILREARTRRGLEVGDERASAAQAGETPAIDYWCEWVRQSVMGGNLATARRYAFAVLRREPGRLRSWQLLLRALLGIRVEALKRWLARGPFATRHPVVGK